MVQIEEKRREGNCDPVGSSRLRIRVFTLFHNRNTYLLAEGNVSFIFSRFTVKKNTTFKKMFYGHEDRPTEFDRTFIAITCRNF